MRKITLLLSTMVLAGMLVVACAPTQPQTTVPSTLPAVDTAVPTSIPLTPDVTLEAPAGTATLSPTQATTPGVPVTGNNDPSRLSNLLRFNVFDQNGEQLGSVSDLVVDLPSASITYVIVDTSGVAGADSKTVFVPWNSLQLQTNNDTSAGQANDFVFQGDVATFNNAPDTNVETTIPQLGQPAANWDTEIRQYWEGAGTSNTPTANATAIPDTAMGNLQGVVLASELVSSSITIGLPAQVGGLNPNATAMPEATAIPDTTQGNQSQQNMLKAGINDAIINTETGKVDYVVVDAVFENIERTIPIPLDMLSWSDAAQSFVLNQDIVTLQNAPFLNSGQFPDTTQENWQNLYSDFWDNVRKLESGSQ